MIWAMMETPHAIINANDIASCSKKLNCFVMGTNDLSKELDLNDVMRRTGLETSILTCLIAAKANKISLIDGVYNNIKDAEGFEEECKYGSGLGLDGKTLIHPSQVDICNKVYSPSDDEIKNAEKIVLTYEEARKENPKVGVIIVDGKQIEELHVIRARKLLAFKNLLGK
jgi:citrate lyase subunit beta/citryl-CoA lyase